MIRRKPESAARARARKSAEAIPDTGIDDIAKRYLRTIDGQLVAVFPGGKGIKANKPLKLDFLDHFDGQTMQAIAEGWVVWNAEKSPNSREVYRQRLKYGFVAWMRDVKNASPCIFEFDEALLRDYADWIGVFASLGFVSDRKLRQSLLGAIEQPLRRLMLSDKWAPKLSPDLKLLDDPFGEARAERQRRGLTAPKAPRLIGRSSYEALWDEAATRVERDFEEHEDDLAKLAELQELQELYRDGLSAAEAASESHVAFADWLLRSYPDNVGPGHSVATRAGTYDGRRVPRSVHLAAERLIFPQLSDILPFIFLTTAFFALNAEVALGMTLDDYSLEEVPGGRRRLRIFPYKPRADARQRNSVAETDDPTNPARFLPYLERRTSFLRKFAPPGASRNVFLYLDPSNRCVRAIEKTIPRFGQLMKEFAASRGVEPISLMKLRLTTLDVIHEITNGDIVATQAVANHKTTSTTHTDYRTEAMSRRYEEAQGTGLAEWERFWGSGGKVDMISRPMRLDRTAATPGYGCADPMSSPVPGETPGRLCQAYGQCPACELALVPEKSPHAYRCLQALLARLEEAEIELSGPAYIARWAEVKFRLVTDHLLRFDDETKAAAENVVVPLLPKLD